MCRGDGTLLLHSVCNKGLYVCTYVLSPPSPFLPPWCLHIHGLCKWQRLKCRVVSVEGNLSLLGTCVRNWYTVTFQAKKRLRTSNTFSMKLQAAASLCCAYKVPGPPTPSLDQKPAWSWGFLKPPKAWTASSALLVL